MGNLVNTVQEGAFRLFLSIERRARFEFNRHLMKRSEVRRITRGYYTIHDDPSLLVYGLKPAYIGLQDAMSFHNLWEQETSPIIITNRKVRCGIRKVMEHNVLVRRISKKYLFGYEHYRHGDFLLPVSDVEKTFIDMVYFGEIEKPLVREFETRIDRKKLEGYLREYPPISGMRCWFSSRDDEGQRLMEEPHGENSFSRTRLHGHPSQLLLRLQAEALALLFLQD